MVLFLMLPFYSLNRLFVNWSNTKTIMPGMAHGFGAHLRMPGHGLKTGRITGVRNLILNELGKFPSSFSFHTKSLSEKGLILVIMVFLFHFWMYLFLHFSFEVDCFLICFLLLYTPLEMHSYI
jgi:hypothetical protein